jgi:MFS family permease
MSGTAGEARKANRLRPEVIILGLAAFFNDAASEMIYPLLPLFITTQLGGTAFLAGLVEGLADAVSAVLKLISGQLSDRMPRRKPFIVSGYGLATLSRIAIAAATSWPTVLGARLADRVGKGIRSAPRDALIADVTPEEQRGRAFGLHRSMDHAGAVVGPLIATLLMAVFAFELRSVFYFAVIPAAIGLLMLMFALREKPVDRKRIRGSEASTGQPLPLEFKKAMVPVALFALANSSDVFLLIQANRAGVATALIPLLWSTHHVLKALLSERAGALSDRIGRRRLLVIGWILYAAVYFVFPMVEGTVGFFVLFTIYSLPFALTEGAERAWVINRVGREARGKAFGVFHMTIGFCTLGGTLMVGGLYEKVGASEAFALGGSLALAAAAALVLQSKTPEVAAR